MSLESHYPSTCPFCRISKAYPPSAESSIPTDPDPALVDPQCHVILSTPYVLAFLDIMPMTPGHVLLVTRDHHEKLSDIPIGTSTEALGFWMPLLSRALRRSLDIEDWNVVQNNGARAAQVVPHVHFHYIPRYPEGRPEAGGKGNLSEGTMRSWRVFGRGAREDLDDDEGLVIAQRIREGLAKELEALATSRVRL